ncbi:ORF112 [Betabaculovirus altermyunipunctae]|uniref:ORF112 n=1 Tax=Betabaculovirus altermyunipunctae TaxID=3051996 RepID=A0A1S5YE07_9BBAC|nr:ORF112 [Betabaculovirus altermyunipunctae]AQQ80379.1 ORF112 [Betabaculovirus altermyunipunctae]
MQHLDIPLERWSVPDVVDAIPLKLAYTSSKDTTPPSAQAVYNSKDDDAVSPPPATTDTNVWFIAFACITVLAIVLLISYYIVSALRIDDTAEPRDLDYDELAVY